MVLERSLKIAEEMQDQQVMSENKLALAQLPSFRNLWLNLYSVELEKIMKKKNNDPHQNNTSLAERHNKYLALAFGKEIKVNRELPMRPEEQILTVS